MGTIHLLERFQCHSDDVWHRLDFLIMGSKLLGFCHLLHSHAAECCDCTADTLACGDWRESVDGSAWSVFGAMHSDWLRCKVPGVVVIIKSCLHVWVCDDLSLRGPSLSVVGAWQANSCAPPLGSVTQRSGSG